MNKQRLFEMMGKLDKTFIIKENQNIDESGFARVKQMMHGLVPSIDTIGIITAENPLGMQLSKEENVERNKRLEQILRERGYGFVKPELGMYGNVEKPFIVQNISKEELIDLSTDPDINQESVIFGSKQVDDEGVYVKWEYIERGRVVGEQTRYTSYAGKDIQDRDDFYTQVKGRKFIIPFFDDEDATSKEPLSQHKYKTDQPIKKKL